VQLFDDLLVERLGEETVRCLLLHHLMRGAIKGSSEIIRGHQRCIRGHQRSIESIRGASQVASHLDLCLLGQPLES